MKFEQLLPAPRVRVAGRNHCHGARPHDPEVGIVVGHTDIFARIVRTVDSVADIRNRGERLEAVQKAPWDIKMSKVVIVKQECLLLAESGRIPADVYKDVVHGPVGAADELRLAAARPAVHAPHDTHYRTRLRVLYERGGRARRADPTIEDRRVERSGEQSPVIAERLRYQKYDAGKVGLLDVHRAMLP